MESINDRIAKCIDASGLTKSAFAEKINVGQPFISQLNSGKKNPSDRTISDICREFNVNEIWLRTGEGEMFIQMDKDEEFDRLCTEIQMSDDEFIKDIMRKYWSLDETGKSIIRQMLSGMPEK